MLDNPLSEEIFLDIQSKPPLAQLEAISSCPVTCYLGKETNIHLATTSFQVAVENETIMVSGGLLSLQRNTLPYRNMSFALNKTLFCFHLVPFGTCL